MYIDTHCHYDLEQFNPNRFELLAALKAEMGIEQIIVPAILAESNENMRRKLDVKSYPELLEGTGLTAEQLPEIRYAAGVHPTRVWGKHAASEEQWESWIRKAACRLDTVAIGETGLDYHHPMDEDMHERQYRWFQKQLALAEEYELPLILHIRMADDDAIEILRQHSLRQGGVVHCYCSGWETAKKYLDMGLMFGIGGAISLPGMDALRDAVKQLPLTSLLLETDAPYVRPVWETEEYNTSKNIPKIAEIIAEIKGISVDEVREQANGNAGRLFISAKEFFSEK